MTADDRVHVLLIGSGAREHALAWKLRQSPRLGALWAIGDNPGILALARRADVVLNPKDSFALRKFCLQERVGLVVVGPEEPLGWGITDALAQPVMPGEPVPLVFGPSRGGAMLECDKAWAKQLLRGAAVPTADGRVFTDAAAARAFLATRTEPHVVKAAGLAKGKGVFVPQTQEEAFDAVERIMTRREFGDAGRTIVIEEKLKGREVSIFALTDGRTIYILESCQDHKRLRDGAQGPNTGGMGALCPTPAATDALLDRVQREILVPTVDALRGEGIDYRGVLYCGLMLTHAGPKVLEYNCRFGDPECQVLMRRLRGDLLDIMLATARGQLDRVELSWEPGAAVCVVCAAPGYPDEPRAGVPIDGLDEAAAIGRTGDGPGPIEIFHGGTKRDAQGRLVTAGGRVLSVTASGADRDQARAAAYEAVGRIRCEGMQVRRDIGTDVVG